MNNEKLKPCPFCGGEAEIVISGGDRRVDCKKCGARSDWYDTEVGGNCRLEQAQLFGKTE